MTGGPVTVVVPTRDRPALLETCLAALRASLRPDDELIVVDSAPRGGGVRFLAADYGARYLLASTPGASLARNLGWQQARHDIIAFVDDDVRVSPGWAAAVARAMDDHAGADFVVGRIGLPEGQDPARPVAIRRGEEAEWLDATTRGPLGHSANLVVRRAVLKALDGFDEWLGAGGRFRAAEDADLFDRMFASGCRGRFEPAVDAVHEQWRRRSDVVALEWAYGIGSGARLAKLIRTDRRRARVAAAQVLWRDGLRRLWAHARRRRVKAAARVALRLAGAGRGFAEATIRARWRPEAASRRE